MQRNPSYNQGGSYYNNLNVEGGGGGGGGRGGRDLEYYQGGDSERGGGGLGGGVSLEPYGRTGGTSGLAGGLQTTRDFEYHPEYPG